MSNFFSSEQFLGAASASLFPKRKYEIVTTEVAGRPFDLLHVDGELVRRLPFADFFEESEGSAERKTEFLPAVSLESVAVSDLRDGAWDQQNGAPWVDWRKHPSWDGFVAMARSRSGRAFEKANRKRNLLTRNFGPLRFELEAQDRALVEQCLAWKSRQYHATGLPDVLARPGRRDLFFALFERGALLVSALYAGARAIAIHLGAHHDGRFLYWVPAYDPETRAGSPGVLLLEELMRASYERGDRELDLLIGMEEYKGYYATDVRLVRPWGRAPLLARAYEAVRPHLLRPVKAVTPLYRTLQQIKRRAVERGIV